jgi:hypothetical protein
MDGVSYIAQLYSEFSPSMQAIIAISVTATVRDLNGQLRSRAELILIF